MAKLNYEVLKNSGYDGYILEDSAGTAKLPSYSPSLRVSQSSSMSRKVSTHCIFAVPRTARRSTASA